MDFRRNPYYKYVLLDLPFVNNKEAYLNLIVGLLYNNMDMVATALNTIKSTNQYTSDDLRRFSNYHRVAKQYENLPYSNELKEALINKYITGPYDYNYDLIRKHEKAYITEISGHIMDLYGLPRIVKAIYSYQDSGIIIVYGGFSHVAKYIDILQKIYGAQIIVQTDDPDDIRNHFIKITPPTEYQEIIKLIPSNAPMRSCIDISTNMMSIIVNALTPVLTKQINCSIKVVT